MKKILFLVVVLVLMFFPKANAYTSGFEYMVTAMNISKINVNGLALNEELYEQYQLLIYGSPISTKDKNQRFKNVSNGKWTYQGGKWNGSGVRGEYWILGEDYTGKSVHNGLFPDDYNSGTSPLNWNYRLIEGAEESWNDTNKYQYDIQREYMLNHKLSRYGVTYDLTALDIGLDKARVENFATWGSAGNIYTEKPGIGSTYWIATFYIPPMAGNATLKSLLDLPNGNKYYMTKEQEYLEIPITFGAYVEGLSEYAKAEHVKKIEAELTVNKISENVVSGSNVVKVTKDGTLLINKNEYSGQKLITLQLECNSFLATYFSMDPLLYHSISQTITIEIEPEEKEKVEKINEGQPPYIYDCSLKRVSSNARGSKYYTDLYIVRKTGTRFICAGQVLMIEVKTSSDATDVTFDFEGNKSIKTLDELTKKFEWDDPKERRVKTRFASLNALRNSYGLPKRVNIIKETETYKLFQIEYVIPYGTTQTLHSWNSLRNQARDAFQIDETKILTRIDKPYSLVIKAYSDDGVRTKTYSLDVAERWDELYNRDISQYMISK